MDGLPQDPTGYLTLADYRRRVAEHYAAVRASADPEAAHAQWREARDRLFRTHPQSPLDAADGTAEYTTPFASYDPAYRILATVSPADGDTSDVAHSAAGSTTFRRFGRIDIDLPTGRATLALFWLAGYGGGIFLPFRDATSGVTTYGGGRYLLDTVKGADLGGDGERIVVDFNFAYHPSCVYSDRWSCPLAPPENHLAIPVPVGELLAH